VTVKSTLIGEGVEDLVRELRILLEKARILRENDLDSEGVSDGDNTDLEGHEDRERLSMSISSLATCTTCLMDLLPSMEDTLNFASQAKDKDESSHPLDFHVSGPARSYILNIFDRFSKANPQLVERLGEANWQRHIALRNGLAKEAEIVHVVIEEAPKSVFVPVSLFQDSGLGTSLPAHTSYAATSASHTSFVSSQADEESRGLRVPPTPKAVSKGIPFSCEICGQTLGQIKNRIDWKYYIIPHFTQQEDCLLTSLDDMFSQISNRTFALSRTVKMHSELFQPGKCGRLMSSTTIVLISLYAAQFVLAAFQRKRKSRPIPEPSTEHCWRRKKYLESRLDAMSKESPTTRHHCHVPYAYAFLASRDEISLHMLVNTWKVSH
jgi:hypothetical protein